MLAWLLAGTALAQQPPERVEQRLDAVNAALQQLQLSADRPDLAPDELQSLRSQIDPLVLSIQSVIEVLTPQLSAAKTRLDQLGTQPTDKATPESAAVTESRKEQQKLYDEIDADFRRARLIAVQADQITATVGRKRRVQFTHALFKQTSSILSPSLWSQVAGELPRDGRALQLLASDWTSSVGSRLNAVELSILAALVAAIGVVAIALSRVGHRLYLREWHVENPTRLQKVMAALWVAFLTAAIPIAVILALQAVADNFSLFNGRLQPLMGAAVDATKRIATCFGLARGVLAPNRPAWRLLAISDEAAALMLRLIVLTVVIDSGFKFIEAVNDVIFTTLTTSVAAHAIGALLVAVAMGLTLIRLSGESIEESASARGGGRQNWHGPVRAMAWIAFAAITATVLVGFVALGAFLVDQMIWIASILAPLYILNVLVEDGVDLVLAPASPTGRVIVGYLGIRRESLDQINVLLSGGLRVAFTVGAIMLVLEPWGLQQEDLTSYLRAAFFGFTIGGATISLSTIVVGVILFLMTVLATKGVQRWLDAKYMPRTRLDTGLRNSINTSVGYLGFIIAASLCFSYLGLSFERLALIAGALSVGIGFGLQSVISNFVSGLILLWERAIRVGDWIVVGQDEGHVRRINVRSTEIETFDRAMVVVPNSSLVTGVVKNWVRGDRVGRVRIALNIAYDSDPERAREILVGCMKAHEEVLTIPAPGVYFANFSATAMQFELICFVDDVERAFRIKSDLNFAIVRALREAGIGIPYSHQDVPGAPPRPYGEGVRPAPNGAAT